MTKTNQAPKPCSNKKIPHTQCKREANYFNTLYFIFVDMLVSLLTESILDCTKTRITQSCNVL